ncbi:hypothetical protein RYA05_04610 [Pseudomonas syringae pv. actinidiae]|nr:hypothetical protein [Pseudomonas syringae pv. actinidiae]
MNCYDDDVETNVETNLVDPTGGKIGDLYGEACKRYSCYEAVVLSSFCNAMRSEFGHDEAADSATAAAFAFARAAFGYQSPDEQRAAEERDWEEGICSHGLDAMTCPCGCFEGD